MLAILNSLNAHNLLIFQLILMILVSKFMVYRALSDKTYLSLGLLSPLKQSLGWRSQLIMSFKQKEVYIQVSFERYKGKFLLNCFSHYLNFEWPIVCISMGYS